jgi:hypothetical protein
VNCGLSVRSSCQRCSAPLILVKDDVTGRVANFTRLFRALSAKHTSLHRTHKPNYTLLANLQTPDNHIPCAPYDLPLRAGYALQTPYTPPSRPSAHGKPHHASSAHMAYSRSPNRGAFNQTPHLQIRAKNPSTNNLQPRQRPHKLTTLSSPMRSPRGPHQTRPSQSTSPP